MSSNASPDKESVISRINKIKTLYEKKHPQTIPVSDSKVTVGDAISISEKVKIYTQNPTDESKKKNFFNLAQQFGYATLLHTSPMSALNNSDDSSMERIRQNIINKNDNDTFQSKLKKFDKIEEKEEKEEKLVHFIQQAHEMCKNYEKEIEDLKNLTTETKKQENINGFNNLEICENNEVQFLKSNSTDNLDKISQDPSSEGTITSLSRENAELVKKIYKLTQHNEETNKTQQKLQSILEEKESTIQGIHIAYQDKISQAFEENLSLTKEIETLKNLLRQKENDITVVLLEKRNLEEKVSAMDLTNTLLKKTHDEDLEKISSLSLINTELKEANVRTCEQVAGDHNEKLVEIIKELRNSLSEKESELELLVKDNFAWEEKYEQLEREAEKMRNQPAKDKSDDLIVEYSKLCCLEANNQELKEKLSAIENRCKQLDEENHELKEVNAKNQANIQEQLSLTTTHLTEENLLAEYDILKKENLLIHEQLLRDQVTIEEHLGIITTLKTEKEELKIQIERRDRALIALKVSKDDLLQKLKAQEGELSVRSRNNSSCSEKMVRSQSSVIPSSDQYAMTKEMIIDYLYCLYIYESSINVHQIVEILKLNFDLFMSNIFLRRDEYNFSFSIINEFLEDIFFRIYDKYMMKALSASRSSNNFLFTSNDIWTINSDDLSREVIRELAWEIHNQNVISSISGSHREIKSLDTIVDLFVKKYETVFDFGTNLSLSDCMRTEIKPLLNIKVEKYKKTMVEEIQALIEQSLRYLKFGKVVLNGKELYSFKNFFVEYFSRDLTKADTLYISKNISSPEALDNITTAVKYSSEKIQKIYLNGSFDGSSELAFSKIALTIMVHSPRILGISITSCNLSGYLLKYVIQMIDYLKNLKYLDLSNDMIGDDGLKFLCEMVKLNKSIVELNLSKNKITSIGGFYLADALIINNTIQKINLGYNRTNENGLSSLLAVIGNNNQTVKDLDISGNHLTEDDYQSISDLLEKNSTITSLNISDNTILPYSASFLGIAIRKSQQLRILNVSNCSINEESAPLLLKHLNECKIQELYMDINPLGEVGAVVFASVVKNNTELKVASLKNCNITSLALSCIAKSICPNTALEELNIEDNLFEDQWLLEFAGVVKDKKVKIKMTALGISEKVNNAFKGVKNISLV